MCKGMTGRRGTMDEPGKEDIYIKKKTNNNYCTIFFYLYNIKYISFYAFYVLHFTVLGL